MCELIRHFLRSRKTCKGLCLTCKYYNICKEDLKHE